LGCWFWAWNGFDPLNRGKRHHVLLDDPRMPRFLWPLGTWRSCGCLLNACVPTICSFPLRINTSPELVHLVVDHGGSHVQVQLKSPTSLGPLDSSGISLHNYFLLFPRRQIPNFSLLNPPAVWFLDSKNLAKTPWEEP
jgi:hypothetical protein